MAVSGQRAERRRFDQSNETLRRAARRTGVGQRRDGAPPEFPWPTHGAAGLAPPAAAAAGVAVENGASPAWPAGRRSACGSACASCPRCQLPFLAFRRRAGARGFSLLELMIVVAIIVILALIALPGIPDKLIRDRIVEA